MRATEIAPGDRDRLRPLLKWAGGKTQLLPQFRRFYPERFGAYVEPFLGSGAVFLDLASSGRLHGRPVRLIDNNPDIIGCYAAVRDAVDQVIAHLQTLAEGHRAGGARHFYDVRDGRFNPLRQALFAERDRSPVAYPPQLAAMLIYLNRTAYNGLFRLNARGGFNVPAGRYRNPRICDPDNLRRVAAALAQPDVLLEVGSFESVRDRAQPNDFVYLDPPYAPISRSARFTAYTANGFRLDDQVRLQEIVLELSRRGCFVMLSNSTATEMQALYEDNEAARTAGLHAYRVPARRAINSRASRRGTVLEYLVTNLTPRGLTGGVVSGQ